MITRIGAAIIALTLIHGSDEARHDGAALVDTVRNTALPEAVPAAIRLCAENGAACRRIAGAAAGEAAPPAPPAAVAAGPAPLPAGAYPLPPIRPDRRGGA